jgi:plastocyanin
MYDQWPSEERVSPQSSRSLWPRDPNCQYFGKLSNTAFSYNSEMRIKTYLMVASLVLAGSAVGSADAATLHTAQIIDFSFAPDPLHVAVGDSVQWANVAPNVDHTATLFGTVSNPFAFDTGAIAQGATSSPVLMTTAGSYTVLCTFHGTAMRQQLVVDATPPADVPEAPIPVLIGLSGLAFLSGVLVVQRRRHRATA